MDIFCALPAVLAGFNPWWEGRRDAALPAFHRNVFQELRTAALDPLSRRGVLLTGIRGSGKTTLLRQLAHCLIDEGVPALNIVYLPMEHPLLRSAGLETCLRTWREFHVQAPGRQYVLIDEMQLLPDWSIDLKVGIDLHPERRPICACSFGTAPGEQQESCCGRVRELAVGPLSFGESLALRGVEVPAVPRPARLAELFSWPRRRLAALARAAEALAAPFNDHLARGGFPGAALAETVEEAQKFVRERVCDRMLRTDMSVHRNVRSPYGPEELFLRLCQAMAPLPDNAALHEGLSMSRRSAGRWLGFLESAHLVTRLPYRPFGGGPRQADMLHMADPSLVPAQLGRGAAFLDNPGEYAGAVGTAVLGHLQGAPADCWKRLAFWRDAAGRPAGFAVTAGAHSIPFAFGLDGQTEAQGAAALAMFMEEQHLPYGVLVTASPVGIGPLETAGLTDAAQAGMLRLPASLLCLWLDTPDLLMAA
ncbi:MAG: AAA family ATPase [Desulfovibrionaceae bacterium]|nr:AAA family ATPase [Desulfovibrionaceae bacterium]